MGVCRPDPRRAQLDLRPRPGRARPGARHRAAAGGVPRRGSPATTRASPCRRSSTSRPARWSPTTSPQITLDLSTRVARAPPAGRARPVPRAAARRDRRGQRAASTPTSTTACTAAGSPARQEAYEEAYDRLFDRLDWLSERLAGQRYLVGDTITEADVRLFTTLVRFDAVYHGHFKCNRQKLTEMPVLWAYARDLFQTPGLRRHRRLRAHQAALLRRAPRHQPDRHRAGRPGPVGLADPARPGGARRPAVRRRHAARAARAGEVVPPEHTPQP